MNDEPEKSRQLTRAVVRLHAGVMAATCALLGGTAVFLMTAWLLLKGGPHVGAHLQLLGQYFYGYTVTWGGCVIGFAYGGVAGGVAGWVIGTVYNAAAGLRSSSRLV